MCSVSLIVIEIDYHIFAAGMTWFEFLFIQLCWVNAISL